MELSQPVLMRVLKDRLFQYFDTVDSTNDIAQEWLRQGARSGAVVIADEQRSGRGRKGRVWHTPPGVAIALSVIVRPPHTALHQVSMLGALAVSDVLLDIGAANVGIKWPNDVQLNSRKVCGILPEVVWDGDKLRGVVLGMGVNVRTDFSDTELESSAISIEPALGAKFNRAELIAHLLQRVDYWTGQFGSEALFEAWRARLNMLQQPVRVVADNGVLSGTAEDVEPEGGLLLRLQDGTVQRVIAGDVLLS